MKGELKLFSFHEDCAVGMPWCRLGLLVSTVWYHVILCSFIFNHLSSEDIFISLLGRTNFLMSIRVFSSSRGFFFNMYISEPAWVYIYYVRAGAHECQKKASNPLELELQMVM